MIENVQLILEWIRVVLYILWMYSIAIIAIREWIQGERDRAYVFIVIDVVLGVFLFALTTRSFFPQIETGMVFDYILTPLMLVGIFVIWRTMIADERNGIEEIKEKINDNSLEKGVS